MKKYIICTLLFISISGFLQAQDSLHITFAKMLTPYLFLNEAALNAKILLFERQWVRGKLLTANNTVVANDSFLFNFDKMERRLLVTKDFNRVFEIDWREFKAILFYIHDSGLVFKHIYPISNKDLFQVLINGNDRYSLYKTMHMKIVKESGASFGSFSRGPEKLVDLPEYCIMFPNHEYRIIHSTKRSAIERIFNLDPDHAKVSDFLNATDKPFYDENDLKNLISYLNKWSL
jgi:hypothetical protein